MTDFGKSVKPYCLFETDTAKQAQPMKTFIKNIIKMVTFNFFVS